MIKAIHLEDEKGDLSRIKLAEFEGMVTRIFKRELKETIRPSSDWISSDAAIGMFNGKITSYNGLYGKYRRGEIIKNEQGYWSASSIKKYLDKK